ncbi:MAG: hypothetical protein IJ530_03775 [Treponema sp.]|uniref:hypothetical protein n=1 Tax=Treponema sp. TaxID=166 RepID=UPI0025CBADEE|nr:hypothetical protein [Treponema sp.]MBQ8678863.1 hypothetical protein [Treponema sp.]
MAIRKMMKAFFITGLAMGLGNVSVFAADIKANVKLGGDIMHVEKDKQSGDKEWSYLSNEPRNQKDDDGLIIEVDNGNAGAHIAMWYKTATKETSDGEDDWAAHFRRTYVWFKPIDMVKIQVGYVGCDAHFKEKIDEWKVGNPFAVTERDWAKHPAYINNCDADGWGFGTEIRPTEQLIINAGITPGIKGSVKTEKKEDTSAMYNKDGSNEKKTKIAPWGLGARYYWNKFEFQASFRDGGQDDKRNGTWRVARFGIGYNDDWTYSFIQPIFGFDYNATKEKWEMNGVCLDAYSEINVDAFKFYLHAPVTIRNGDAKTDVNYMEFNFKAEYNTGSHANIDDLKPYIQLSSNQDDAAWGNTVTRVWLLDKHFKDSFNMSYKVGMNFMISGAEIDVGVKYDQLSKYHKVAYGKSWIVSVPFTVKMKNF